MMTLPMEPRGDLLSRKELAGRLGRSVSYVKQMVRRGFVMAGGRATVAEARAWQVRNPKPFAKTVLGPKNL